ncbi:MAG: glutamate-5-semialdehyde dehydrogenase [Oscillospiraceae bacterium]
MTYIETLGEKAKNAEKSLSIATTKEKNDALEAIAAALCENSDEIIEKNKIDLENGKLNGFTVSLLDRLALSKERINEMAKGVRDIALLPDPVGAVISETIRPNGLKIQKISVPLGVIAVIFEARPNVTSDAAALCLKSGNAVILRGGKEAINSNTAISKIMREAIKSAGLSIDCIEFVEDTSRESANELMRLNKYIDVLIPRGGAGLIKATLENSTVPVIETGVGNCHIYIDKMADLKMAAEIVFNAKCSRPSVCNAAESLLIHKDIAEKALPVIYEKLSEKNVVLFGDEKSKSIINNINLANNDDWGREYLDLKMSVKIVDNIDEAIEHIFNYGTGHSECIVTNDQNAADEFQKRVDAAAVYHNASTRFTDGGEFGFGAEIGISTQKLHARGPLGLPQLNSVKYKITGNGQIR